MQRPRRGGWGWGLGDIQCNLGGQGQIVVVRSGGRGEGGLARSYIAHIWNLVPNQIPDAGDRCFTQLDSQALNGQLGQLRPVGAVGGSAAGCGQRGLFDGKCLCNYPGEARTGNSDFCRIPGIDIVVVGHGIVIRRRQRLPVHGDGNAGFLFFAVIGQSQIIWQRNRQLCPTDASALCEVTLLRNRLRSAEGAGLGVGGGP